jgi:diguanylate cyclase (GGDEF)-like protein
MYVTGWFVGCLTDLETENRKYLVKLANTDMLTGLYNHRYFQEKLKRYFENAPEENTLSLIIIDIDYFKHYNDSFGHLEGDNVLKTIGEIIRESVLEPNYAARYGGEEFVVVLPGRDAREASRLAEIIRQKIENRHFPGGEHQPGGKVTVSCGIATYPDHASNARELVKHADLALYRAKSLNKNKVELYFSVFDDLELEEDEKELLNSIRTLVSVINAKDRYTYGHSERVTDFSIKLAQKLNLPEKDIRLLKYAAFLHDIGKIEIDRDILNKAGPPDKEQWFILRQHPQWGSDIVKSVAKLQPIAPAILHHHENFDGSGYPAGISGKDIPLPARIIRITDSYDAMTTDRPYKKSMSKDEAIREIKRCAGTMFDPDLVNLFISIIDDETKLADGPA